VVITSAWTRKGEGEGGRRDSSRAERNNEEGGRGKGTTIGERATKRRNRK